jgi:GT2 family glycosyltransferase
MSVVISTYSTDKKDLVLDCINSLRDQSVPPNEILLVLDKNPALIDFYKSVVPKDVIVIGSDGFGLSRARNAGARYARSEIVAFIDDDAVADKDWVKNTLSNYADPSVVGVGGLIKPDWNGGKSAWFPEELNWVVGCSYKGLSDRSEPIRNPIGCNMSFRHSVFEKVGYFRADVGRLGKILLDGEEPEFSLRVHKKIPGAKIMNAPSAVVLHKISPGRKKFSYLWKRSFYQGFSKGIIDGSRQKSDERLTLENSYVRFLLTVSIKHRIRKFYRLQNLSQLAVLVVSTSMVFAGFVVGKIWSR